MRLLSVLLTPVERPSPSSQARHPSDKNPRSAGTGNRFNHDQKTVQTKNIRFFSGLLEGPVPPDGPVDKAQSRCDDWSLADLTRRGGQTD